MSKDVINVNGEDVLVREDTAKAFRGVNWAIVSLIAFIVIAAVLFFIFFVGSTARDGSVGSPATQDQSPR